LKQLIIEENWDKEAYKETFLLFLGTMVQLLESPGLCVEFLMTLIGKSI
jgi:hypothetical protein